MQAVTRRGPGATLEAAMAVAPVLGVATSIILAQMLGPSGRGQMSTLTVWAQGAALVCFISLDKGLVDAANRAPEDRRFEVVLRCRAAAATVAWALSALSGVVALASLVGLHVASLAALAGALGALFTCRAEWRAGMLVATRHWSRYNSWRVVQPAVYAVGLLALWGASGFVSDRLRLYLAALAFVLSTLVGWLWLRGGGRTATLSQTDEAISIRPLLGFAARYHVTTMATFAATRADLLTAPMAMAFASVGVYAVAVAPGSLIAAAASASLLRALTGHASSSRWWVPASLVAAVTAVGCLAAPLVIPLAFGHEFRDAVFPAQVLMLASLFYYVSQGITGRLAHAGRPATASLPSALCVAVIVAGAFITRTPDGLALSVLVGRVLALVCGLVLVRRVSPTTETAMTDAPSEVDTP